MDLWQQALATNLTGTSLTFREALAPMELATPGRLVAIASTAALKGYSYVSAYCAAKHGVVGLVRALAQELSRTKETVNAICSGFADTPMLERSVNRIAAQTGTSATEAKQNLAAYNRQGRLVQPDDIALIGNGRRRTYKELADWTNRIAHTLVVDYGLKPGNRVLIRSANNPAMVACWLAATKAGAVVVNTMAMLRAAELAKIIDKAEISLALCDTLLTDELVECGKTSRHLETIVGFDDTANHDTELDSIALDKPVQFLAVQTGKDDVALLGFTSGTTGEPKATMHFHRDLMIIADGYAKDILGVTPDDIFVGSPPLAFTFGLGGLAIFPLRYGAAATLLEDASPPNMIEIIESYRAIVCFTAPTAFRAMLAAMADGADLSSLRAAAAASTVRPCWRTSSPSLSRHLTIRPAIRSRKRSPMTPSWIFMCGQGAFSGLKLVHTGDDPRPLDRGAGQNRCHCVQLCPSGRQMLSSATM